MTTARQKFSQPELLTFLRDAEAVKSLLNETTLFDTGYYLANNHDVLESEHTPVEHFAIYGSKEQRQPHPLFDPQHYRSQLKDENLTPEIQEHLLIHYLLSADAKYFSPHPLFDASYYLTQRQSDLPETMTALEDFLASPIGAQLDPHPFFVLSCVQAHCPQLIASRENPLSFYLKTISCWGISTHPQFDGTWYLEHNEDVKEAGINPLLHFITHGQKEARSSSPLLFEEFVKTESTPVHISERIIRQYNKATELDTLIPIFSAENFLNHRHTPGRGAPKRMKQLQLLKLAQGRSIQSVIFLPDAKTFRNSALRTLELFPQQTLVISLKHDAEFRQTFGDETLLFALSEIFINTYEQDIIEALKLLLLVHRPTKTYLFSLPPAWELLKQYGLALSQITEFTACFRKSQGVLPELSSLAQTFQLLHSVIVSSQGEKDFISKTLGLLPEEEQKFLIVDSFTVGRNQATPTETFDSLPGDET